MHIMSSNEFEALKKPLNNKSSHPQIFGNLKFSIKSFLSHHPPTHRTILFTVVLFQVFLFLYFSRTTNLSPSESPQPLQEFQAQPLQEFQAGGFESPQPLQESQAQPLQEFQAGGFQSSQPLQEFQASRCDTRWIYVYDLPPMINSELANKCNQIDPWHNKCDKFLNDGFGLPAKELDGIVPESTLPAWYWTDHFWGEVVYHYRMLNYKCRTLEPESATAFYVPFCAGLAVGKYLWGNHTGRERDWHAEMLSKWLQEQKWWKRSNGSDHFLMLGRMTWDFRRLRDADSHWGSSFLYMPAMRNVIRLSVERNVWDDRDSSVAAAGTISSPTSAEHASRSRTTSEGFYRTSASTSQLLAGTLTALGKIA
ncbi:hypothetical protein Vadar_020522 [Vaccinium darrowii]|uniref:Uncharacterized protein n=1 Tax=Vaccinium darrowii TaxID=229202 RepID=A0ACB7Y0F6_9ERIC|nr:hypothetical protein Vadar_020522 [Vaccinium darrowii]